MDYFKNNGQHIINMLLSQQWALYEEMFESDKMMDELRDQSSEDAKEVNELTTQALEDAKEIDELAAQVERMRHALQLVSNHLNSLGDTSLQHTINSAITT